MKVSNGGKIKWLIDISRQSQTFEIASQMSKKNYDRIANQNVNLSLI